MINFNRFYYATGVFLIFCLLLMISVQAFSSSGGRTGRTLKTSTNGCNCHSSRDVTVSVPISGPSSVTTGQTNTFSITINKAGRTGAGVDIAVRRGALGVVSTTLHLQSSELTNNDNIAMSGGQVTLQFSYTAPASPAIDTIFATGLATNSDGEDTGDSWNWATSFQVVVNPPAKILHLTALIEGFYNTVSGFIVKDTVRAYLRNTAAPYALIDSSVAILDSLGKGNYSFANASNAVPYYIELKHRNSIETWSGTGQSFTADALTYDFTTASSQAYGNNLKLAGTRYCDFSGDVTQDGFVDLTDITLIYNDASAFVTGYKATDVTGDSLIDLADIVLTYNNSSAFVSIQRP